MELKISNQILPLLKSENLKYIIFDHSLFELDDILYNEEAKKLWKTKQSEFYAWKFHVKPNIKPRTLFKAYNGDLWIRLKNDITRCLVLRNATRGNKDLISNYEISWKNEWYELVGCLTEDDWERDYPSSLKEDLSDQQISFLLENPPLNQTEEEILWKLNH